MAQERERYYLHQHLRRKKGFPTIRSIYTMTLFSFLSMNDPTIDSVTLLINELKWTFDSETY